MIKLSAKVLNGLGKVPPTKSKIAIFGEAATNTVKRNRVKLKGPQGSQLERMPKVDTVTISGKTKTAAIDENSSKGMRIGDFFVEQNRKHAERYLNDLADMAQEFPDVTFVRAHNVHSTKSLDSTLSKLARADEQLFEKGGFHGAVRDGMRATLYMPNANKNYQKIVEAMHQRGYRIASTFAEDSKGFMVLGEDGVPKMAKDIDIRFGTKAQPSGYEDVQMRFEKFKMVKDPQTGEMIEKATDDGNLFELIILPGPNYHAFKDIEHKAVYEHTRRYKELGFTKDKGSDKIIDGIKKEFRTVTAALYKDAEMRDVKGAASITAPVTFTKKSVQNLKEYFDALENLWLGKYASLPPSKQTKPFKETLKYKQLKEVRENLSEFVKLYAPKD